MIVVALFVVAAALVVAGVFLWVGLPGALIAAGLSLAILAVDLSTPDGEA